MNRSNLLILFTLALLSALIAERLIALLPPLSPLFYILMASLIFMLIFLAFDRYLWRWLRIGNRPTIHGKWLGRLSSSYTDNSEVEPFTVFIVQRWLSSRIDFDSSFSKSSSVASIFFPDKDGHYILTYIYLTQPFEGTEGKASAHFGLTVLHLNPDGRLIGFYHHLDAKDGGYDFVHGQLVMMRPE